MVLTTVVEEVAAGAYHLAVWRFSHGLDSGSITGIVVFLVGMR
jgi:hypothetical protein